MRQEIEAAPEKLIGEAECRHYWIIDSPKGRTSKGICKLCGVEKEFLNYAQGSWREDDLFSESESSRLPDLVPDGERDDS